MLNSPSNPTGAVYSRSELEALLDVLIPTDVAVLSDEIYELLTYDDHKPTCVATLRPEFKERIITISGASKSYAMTGWRLGWTVAPKNVVKAMDTIQSQETSCPSSIAQHAIITALKSPETAVAVNQMRGEFDARRKLGMKLLSGIPGLKVFPPQGAFYLFFDVSAYFGKSFQGKVVSNSAGFCETLLEQAHVNLVTGSAFGAEGFARMSFATSPEVIEAGLSRFGQWLAQAN
jgi:aspartate aminotransferase